MKHSPGPWHVHMGHLIKCEVGLVIADVEKNPSHILKEARIANARLIAAAPDMLALLSDLTTAWDASRLGDGGHHAMIRRAHAIIARVEGNAA